MVAHNSIPLIFSAGAAEKSATVSTLVPTTANAAINAMVMGRYSRTIVACPNTLMARVIAAIATTTTMVSIGFGSMPIRSSRANAATDAAARFNAK